MLDFIRDLFCPVLSDRTIMKYNKKGLLITGDIAPEQLQPNSVDLTLDDGYAILDKNNEDIDVKKHIEYDFNLFHDGKVVIPPKQFVLMSSRETLKIPNGIIAFVQGRSSIARIGLQVEQAGLIDAGFEGRITLELYNETDKNITLYDRMRIAQVYFFKAEKADVPYGEARGSKYFNQRFATGSKIDKDFR